MTPSYALGLLFIFLVSIIWAAASIVVQHLYRDMGFDSPFLLTYVSTSLFVLYLPNRLLWERRKKLRRWIRDAWRRTASGYRAVENNDGEQREIEMNLEDDDIIPWRSLSENVNDDGAALPFQHSDTRSGLELSNANNSAPGGCSVFQAAETPSVEAEDTNSSFDTIADEETESTMSGGDGCRVDPETVDNFVRSDEALVLARSHDESVGMSPREEYRVKSGRQTAETSLSTVSTQTVADPETSTPPFHLLSHVDHISMALRIAPVWFLSNYFYNTSLAYTSISSSTVLASTGSLFTFLFASTCGDEKVTASKVAGVALCFTGSVITGLSDAEAAVDGSGSDHVNVTDFVKPTVSLDDFEMDDFSSLSSESAQDEYNGLQVWGDLAGLISAVGYGTYTVMIRNLCPKDESRMSMQLLLGYIGSINGIALLPIVLKILVFSSCAITDGDSSATNSGGTTESLSTCEQISLAVLAYLLGKALIDNVLSDYLWARAVVLTSSTVATVGLGLTIPLAFLSDWFIRHDVMSIQSFAGALAVLVGFVLVNCGETGDEDVDEHGRGVETPS